MNGNESKHQAVTVPPAPQLTLPKLSPPRQSNNHEPVQYGSPVSNIVNSKLFKFSVELRDEFLKHADNPQREMYGRYLMTFCGQARRCREELTEDKIFAALDVFDQNKPQKIALFEQVIKPLFKLLRDEENGKFESEEQRQRGYDNWVQGAFRFADSTSAEAAKAALKLSPGPGGSEYKKYLQMQKKKKKNANAWKMNRAIEKVQSKFKNNAHLNEYGENDDEDSDLDVIMQKEKRANYQRRAGYQRPHKSGRGGSVYHMNERGNREPSEYQQSGYRMSAAERAQRGGRGGRGGRGRVKYGGRGGGGRGGGGNKQRRKANDDKKKIQLQINQHPSNGKGYLVNEEQSGWKKLPKHSMVKLLSLRGASWLNFYGNWGRFMLVRAITEKIWNEMDANVRKDFPPHVLFRRSTIMAIGTMIWNGFRADSNYNTNKKHLRRVNVGGRIVYLIADPKLTTHLTDNVASGKLIRDVIDAMYELLMPNDDAKEEKEKKEKNEKEKLPYNPLPAAMSQYYENEAAMKKKKVKKKRVRKRKRDIKTEIHEKKGRIIVIDSDEDEDGDSLMPPKKKRRRTSDSAEQIPQTPEKHLQPEVKSYLPETPSPNKDKFAESMDALSLNYENLNMSNDLSMMDTDQEQQDEDLHYNHPNNSTEDHEARANRLHNLEITGQFGFTSNVDVDKKYWN